jgi:predicted Zn finger-like uncharacterized protein
MKIICQSCQSKYTVSDEKVQGKTVKIKCRKCGATILVNSGGVTTSSGSLSEADSLASGGADGGPTFMVNVAEGDQRSMSLADIIAAYNSTSITVETYVWTDGMGDWQPLGQVESIVAALQNPEAAAAPAAAPSAGYAAAPAAEYAAPEPLAAPEPAAPRTAAKRDPGRRPADLFASSNEIATSAPVLNGGIPAAAPAARPATGQRDDNSTLFSLSALTAKAAGPTTPSISAKSSAKVEDSGLIDLKALAGDIGSPKSMNSGLLVPDSAGLFPLGAPALTAPVAAAPGAMPAAPPPSASKAPIFIGIGIAVAALAIVGAFVVMKGSGEKPVPAESVALPVPPPPPVETVAEPTPPPSATAEASAAPTATAKVGGKFVPRGGGGGKTSPGSAPAATAAPATPPPPKKSACGCAPGDLMCAMKCSAK